MLGLNPTNSKTLKPRPLSNWFVYLLVCNDGTLYCGITKDVERRVREHNGLGKLAGAKYTRTRRPCTLAYFTTVSNRSQAAYVEHSIKAKTRQQKLALIAGSELSSPH